MMHMRTLGWIAGLLLLAGGAAQAAETLIVPPYPAAAPWKKITDKHDTPGLVWIEWIPADQTEADIHDILTEQIFAVQKGRDPSDFVHTLFGQLKGACRAVSVNGPTPQTESGFAVAYGQVYCVGAGDKDADIFIKAIAGHDALYVVQREFRRPAEPGAIPGMRKFPKGAKDDALAALHAQEEADQFLLKQVKLCAGDACESAPASAPASVAPSAQPSGQSQTQPGNDDVSSVFGFEAGKTTQDQVEDKFGHPAFQNHRSDGEHVDLYQFKNGVTATFLFGKDDVLIRTMAYRQQ
jgi:hypothetical protein